MNDWATSYTPAFGLRSLFNNGLDGSVQGLSQNGANAFGKTLQGVGAGMMTPQGGQSGQMLQNPALAFAGGINNTQQGMNSMNTQQRAFGSPEAAPADPEKQGGFGGLDIKALLGLRPLHQTLKDGGMVGHLFKNFGGGGG
jgi:hypothetical protein